MCGLWEDAGWSARGPDPPPCRPAGAPLGREERYSRLLPPELCAPLVAAAIEANRPRDKDAGKIFGRGMRRVNSETALLPPPPPPPAAEENAPRLRCSSAPAIQPQPQKARSRPPLGGAAPADTQATGSLAREAAGNVRSRSATPEREVLQLEVQPPPRVAVSGQRAQEAAEEPPRTLESAASQAGQAVASSEHEEPPTQSPAADAERAAGRAAEVTAVSQATAGQGALQPARGAAAGGVSAVAAAPDSTGPDELPAALPSDAGAGKEVAEEEYISVRAAMPAGRFYTQIKHDKKTPCR